MLTWDHGGGFSLDGSVRIEASDRAGLERLLRYCARPPSALEFLHRLATLLPPPRIHRHRYHGVFAPNAPLRPLVTAWAREDNATAQPDLVPGLPLRAQPASSAHPVAPAPEGSKPSSSSLTNPQPITRILAHIGEPTSPPMLYPARAPPQTEFDLVGPHANQIGATTVPDDLDQTPEFDATEPESFPHLPLSPHFAQFPQATSPFHDRASLP